MDRKDIEIRKIRNIHLILFGIVFKIRKLNFIFALCCQNKNESKEYNSLLGFHDQLVYYNLLVTIINNKNSNYYKKIIIIIDSTLQYGIVFKTVSGEVYKRITGTKTCFI